MTEDQEDDFQSAGDPLSELQQTAVASMAGYGMPMTGTGQQMTGTGQTVPETDMSGEEADQLMSPEEMAESEYSSEV